jgi:catechol-2,3-dioxygenase
MQKSESQKTPDVRTSSMLASTPSAYDKARLLAETDAVANIAVRDIETAKRFYEDTLGLEQVGVQGHELIVLKSGNSIINVYRSQYAGTNQATCVTWTVHDVEGVVDALAAKGITFEHYDMPDMRRVGDIHLAGDMKVAWFKDPDGNILSIVNM